MARVSSSAGRWAVSVLGACLLLGGAAGAQVRRPTPHEGIDRAMTPVTAVLSELHVTDAERAEVADLVARAEEFATSVVSADHRGEADRSRALTRRIDWCVRAIRGRVEAMRAESAAVEAERLALEAEAHRTQARAALERLSERRTELDRGTTVATMRLPPPDAPRPATQGSDAGGSSADAATGDR